MDGFFFLFDLDTVIMKEGILTSLEQKFCVDEDDCIKDEIVGEVPFAHSYVKRIEMLQRVPVSQISNIVKEYEISDKVGKFISNNRERCYIVTENIDVWVKELVKKLGMDGRCFWSKALVREDYLQNIISIIDKGAIVRQMQVPIIAIGNRNNDAEMIEVADIGIGYGRAGVIADSVLDNAFYAVVDENKLVGFLEKFL